MYIYDNVCFIVTKSPKNEKWQVDNLRKRIKKLKVLAGLPVFRVRIEIKKIQFRIFK